MKTFKHAFKGIIHVFKNERNFKIHILATIAVIIAGFVFKISPAEWLAVIIVIASVTAFEMLNSAIEYISDFVSPDYNEKIKIIKDVSAGAVLISATAALLTACIIFIPKFFAII